MSVSSYRHEPLDAADLWHRLREQNATKRRIQDLEREIAHLVVVRDAADAQLAARRAELRKLT